jgi:hypothetical protein
MSEVHLTGTAGTAVSKNSIKVSKGGRKWTVEQKKAKSDERKAHSAAKKAAKAALIEDHSNGSSGTPQLSVDSSTAASIEVTQPETPVETANETTGVPEQPTGSLTNSEQIESAVIGPSERTTPDAVVRVGTLTGILSVELPDNESGIFSQIASTDQLIPSPCHESLENMTDESLDQFVVGHYDGLKKNMLALAEGLSEKKHRLVRKGCEGKWSGWVTENIGMSVSWADRLVRNLDFYRQFAPRVRQAAEEAGVNFAKPAVLAVLRALNDEFLANGDPGVMHFAACVQALKIAGMRQKNGRVVPAGAPGESGSDGKTEPEDTVPAGESGSNDSSVSESESVGGNSEADGTSESECKSTTRGSESDFSANPKSDSDNDDSGFDDSGDSKSESVGGESVSGPAEARGSEESAEGQESDPHAEKARSMIAEAKRQLEEAKRRRKEIEDSNPAVTVDFTLSDVPKDEYALYESALKRDPKRWDDILRRAFHEFIDTEPVEPTSKKLEILPEDEVDA